MLARTAACTLLLYVIGLPLLSRAAAPLAEAPSDAHASAAGAAKHSNAGHEHIGTANAGPGVEQPEEVRSDLAVWTFVVFLCLLAILWKFAWGPIVAGLEKREQAISDNIAAAERSHAEAKRLLAEYEQKLATAADQVRGLMEEARRDAERTKAVILDEAKTAAETERARALRDIDAATDAALKSLAERSADLAVDLAGRIVRAKLSPQDHAQLIQEAVARFPQVSHN